MRRNGFDLAFERMGRVPLGHNILDARTMENRLNVNIAGMTAGLPLDARKVFQRPAKQNHPARGEQTLKNKLAGIVVDPTAIETAQGADNVSVDTAGGPGLNSMPGQSVGGG